jgi:hypothetical protein
MRVRLAAEDSAGRLTSGHEACRRRSRWFYGRRALYSGGMLLGVESADRFSVIDKLVRCGGVNGIGNVAVE